MRCSDGQYVLRLCVMNQGSVVMASDTCRMTKRVVCCAFGSKNRIVNEIMTSDAHGLGTEPGYGPAVLALHRPGWP